MIAKLAAVAALAVAPVSASVEVAHYPKVEQVICSNSRGTAFEAGGKIISVAHVTTNPGCSINSVPIIASNSETQDFSIIAGKARGYRINCNGFRDGEMYWAVGYANGLAIQEVITLVGTGEYASNGMAVLWGWPTVIPGMSGGPVINLRGEVVGTINMYNRILPVSLSVALKDTPLCQA